jgi:hypothetical protein
MVYSPRWCNSMLGIRPKIRGFKPGQGDRVIKVCSMPPFGGEVKPEAPSYKILRHAKKNHLQL